jgi:hypothetical protein
LLEIVPPILIVGSENIAWKSITVPVVVKQTDFAVKILL